MEPHSLSNLRLGIFGKGGSGKSTVTVFLARALRRLGYSVLVLDADSTNVGLSWALGADREPRPLLDHFGGMVFSGGAVTCPVDDPAPLAGGSVSIRDLAPAFVTRTGDGIRLLVAGKLGPLGPGAGCDGPIVKIARDLEVTDLGPDPVTLVDFKAGFEDAARGTITSVDWAVVVVDPTTAAVQMAEHLAGLVSGIREGVPPATAHLETPEAVTLALRVYQNARVRGVLSVMNRLTDSRVEADLQRRLDGSGAEAVGAIPEDPPVAMQWLQGSPLQSTTLDDVFDGIVTKIQAVARDSVRAAIA